MPCGAVFENNTGITKKTTIELTNEEIEVIKQHRQYIDIEFRLLEKEGSKIYPHQKEAARKIVDSLNGEKLINMMTIAPTQSGKTGIICEVIRLFIKETNISYKNIYVITGLSSVEWKIQTKSRLPDKLKKRVFHRCDLNAAFLGDIRKKKDILIIFDEIQIASAKDQTIHKVFDELNFMNLKTLLQKNVKMLEITATPNGSVYELMKWGNEFSNKMIVEPPAEYISCFNLLDENRVFQYKDLCDDIFVDKKIVRAIDNLRELKDNIDNFYDNDPRYHFIRTKTAESQEKTKNNFKQVFGNDVNIIEFDMENKETDINNIVKNAPKDHTFIFVKEKLRCAKTIENKNLVGVYYERYTGSIPDDDVIIQGMLGRATGYNDNGDSIIFTHIPSIDKYRKLLTSEFNDRTVNWFSSSTVIKNNKIRGINFFNTPDNIRGFKVVEYDNESETKEERKERITKQKIEREERKQTKALEKEEKQRIKEEKQRIKEEKQREKEAKKFEREQKQKEREDIKKAKEALKEQQKKEKEELKEQKANKSKEKEKKNDNFEDKPKPKKTKKAKDDESIKSDSEISENSNKKLQELKTSFRIKIKRELSNYSKEYNEINNKTIDLNYLNNCLKIVCTKTYEDDFESVCNDHGDPKTWELDIFRKFIRNFSDLYTKYPLEKEDKEEQKENIIEEEIPEVQPKKLKKVKKMKISDNE